MKLPVQRLSNKDSASDSYLR